MISNFDRHFYYHWLKPGSAPHWLQSDLNHIEEGAFDCQSCFMIRPQGLTRDLGPFDVNLKCCTYHPFLPNFTLGALFLEVEAGRLSGALFQSFLQQSYLKPIGAFPRKPATSVCETGRHPTDKCPFLVSGQCQIHEFRPSVCASYVCRTFKGRQGFKEWEGREQRLQKFEWSLANEAAFEMGFTTDDTDVSYESIDVAVADYVKAHRIARLTSVRDWDE